MDTLSHHEPDDCHVVVRRSIHEECRVEEDLYRWLECEKANRDLGDDCILDWVRKYWDAYLHARWVEHIEGRIFWVEFAADKFGLVKRPQHYRNTICDPVVERLKAGKENLDIICWATSEQQPLDQVRHVLEVFDVNSRRLQHRLHHLCA